MGGCEQLEGVVIRLVAYGESHRLVEALTAPYGRMILVAPGARHSQRRFGAVDLFVQLRMQARQQRDRWTLTSACSLRSRMGIRTSYDLIQRAGRLCEMVRVLAPENVEATAFVQALVAGLDALHAGTLAQAAVYHCALLQAAGLLPQLDRCQRCQRQHHDIAIAHIGPEGVQCPACWGRRDNHTDAIARAMRSMQTTETWVADALERTAMAMAQHHTGRVLRTQPTAR